MSSFFATVSLNAPKTGNVTLSLSATISTTSPFSAPQRSRIDCNSPSARNFAKPQLGSSSTQRINASPFAPMPRTYSVSLSISLRVSVEAAFFATIARTLPPASIADENTPKPLFATKSERFIISIPNRVSGLSEPKRSIASLYVRRGSGVGMSVSRTSLNILFIIPSPTSKISSTSTNDISRSICVNSG